jgi:hypothetical protein
MNFLYTIVTFFCLFTKLHANTKYAISDMGIAERSQAFRINNKGEVAGTISIGWAYYVFKWSPEEGVSVLFESDGEMEQLKV